MGNYFIAFDLSPSDSEREREPIALVIIETFAPYCFQVLSNGWYVKSNQSADDLFRWLRELISPSPNCVVIPIVTPMWGLPADTGWAE